jgi:hypothetical protein
MSKFNLNEYMKSNRNGESDYANVEAITCADGFQVSAQASSSHYCSPRVNRIDYYMTVELGFPSEFMGVEFNEFCEDITAPTETVYGYVPIELVEDLIERHGGLKAPETSHDHD